MLLSRPSTRLVYQRSRRPLTVNTRHNPLSSPVIKQMPVEQQAGVCWITERLDATMRRLGWSRLIARPSGPFPAGLLEGDAAR